MPNDGVETEAERTARILKAWPESELSRAAKGLPPPPEAPEEIKLNAENALTELEKIGRGFEFVSVTLPNGEHLKVGPAQLYRRSHLDDVVFD